MKDSEIMHQLSRLIEALPLDKCDVWLCWLPETKSLQFTAYVSAREPLPSVSDRGPELAAVVDSVLKQSEGKRGPSDMLSARQQQIDKLRAELSKLEQESDPLLRAVAAERNKQHENP